MIASAAVVPTLVIAGVMCLILSVPWMRRGRFGTGPYPDHIDSGLMVRIALALFVVAMFWGIFTA